MDDFDRVLQVAELAARNGGAVARAKRTEPDHFFTWKSSRDPFVAPQIELSGRRRRQREQMQNQRDDSIRRGNPRMAVELSRHHGQNDDVGSHGAHRHSGGDIEH